MKYNVVILLITFTKMEHAVKNKKNPAKKGKMEDEKQDSRFKVVVINDVVIMEEEKQDKKGEESLTG
jgi:hypothetical protein